MRSDFSCFYLVVCTLHTHAHSLVFICYTDCVGIQFFSLFFLHCTKPASSTPIATEKWGEWKNNVSQACKYNLVTWIYTFTWCRKKIVSKLVWLFEWVFLTSWLSYLHYTIVVVNSLYDSHWLNQFEQGK